MRGLCRKTAQWRHETRNQQKTGYNRCVWLSNFYKHFLWLCISYIIFAYHTSRSCSSECSSTVLHVFSTIYSIIYRRILFSIFLSLLILPFFNKTNKWWLYLSSSRTTFSLPFLSASLKLLTYVTFSLVDVSTIAIIVKYCFPNLVWRCFLNSTIACLCSPLEICPCLPVLLWNFISLLFCSTRANMHSLTLAHSLGCLFSTFGSSLDIYLIYSAYSISGHTKIFNDSQFIRHPRKNYEKHE